MRTRWLFLGLGALIVVALFAFPFWWPIVNVSQISQALPGLTDLPLAEQDIIEQIALENLPYAEALIATGLEEPSVVPMDEQPLPAMQGPTIYARGTFTEIDAVHRAEGNVIAYQKADGSWLIRLEDFAVRNGPQLHMFLSAHPEPRTPEEVRLDDLALDWGLLKGVVGSQNYALPAGFDMSAVRSVVIYSVTFQDVFSSAQLF
jgi:hypothetical protein